MNLDLMEFVCLITHWIDFYIHDNYTACFESFGVQHIPDEIRQFIDNKNTETNIQKVQVNN